MALPSNRTDGLDNRLMYPVNDALPTPFNRQFTEKVGPRILTMGLAWATIPFALGPVAQLGERYNRTVEAKGSNPFRSTHRV